MTPDLVLSTAGAARSALLPYAGADWSVTACGEWSAARTAVHVADSWFSQAAQLVTRRADSWLPVYLTVEEPVTPEAILDAMDGCARILATVAAAARPDARAYHPFGAADATGWLAMGVTEGLVHTWDVVRALGGDWRPPDDLAAAAVARLFPNAPRDAAPADALLWCTGRIALPGRPLLGEWRWWSGE